MSRNKEHRPNGAVAEGDRPSGGAAEGGASVFFVSAHLFCILCILIDIPYFFLHLHLHSIMRTSLPSAVSGPNPSKATPS